MKPRLHIFSRKGMFTLDKIEEDFIFLSTRHYSFTTKINDFKCFAGGINSLHILEMRDIPFINKLIYKKEKRCVDCINFINGNCKIKLLNGYNDNAIIKDENRLNRCDFYIQKS